LINQEGVKEITTVPSQYNLGELLWEMVS